MSELLSRFIFGIVGVLASSAGLLIVLAIKWLFSIKKNVDSMVNNGRARAAENLLQFKMMRAQGKAINALSTASKTILEVTAKNINNGNVEKAFREIACADEELDAAQKKYDEFSDSLIGNETTGGKK